MLGTGKWECQIDSMFFKGIVFITISDNNGEYVFNIEIPNEKIPEFEVFDVKTEGNTMSAKAKLEQLRDNEIELEITFNENAFVGFMKIPFVGRVKLRDGKKIS